MLRPIAARLTPFLLGLALTLAVAAAPQATSRYVAVSGDDGGGTNGCTAAAAPCRTLAHALGVAQPGDTIHLAPGVYSESGLLVAAPVTVRGGGAATTTLDGQRGDTVLTVAPGAALTLEDVALRGGAGQRGGAILVEDGGDLILRRATLVGNDADWGGGLFLAGGAALVEDSQLIGNSAGGGGAVFADGGALTIARSRLEGNRAATGGGLFVGAFARAAVARTTFTGNEAGSGGGVYAQGTFQATNTLWRDNRATDRGGGLFSDGGQVTLAHTAWLDNEAARGGGLAGTGDIALRQSYVSGGRGGACAATLAGGENLLPDTTCGLPARPVTDLTADGRPRSTSNALDALPPDRCQTADDQPLTADLRGQPRPTDGDDNGEARCDIGPYEFQPRIVIIHNPSLPDATRFDLGGDLGPFSLSAERPARAFEVMPGSYRLTQERKANWKLTAITCSGDADNGSAFDLAGRAATLDLDPGEALRCVFNQRPTRNSIGVILSSENGVAVPFDGDLGGFTLRLPAAADRRPGRLAAGEYTVRAYPPAGWRVTDITCVGDADLGSRYDPANSVVAIDLDRSETLGCVFRVAPQTPTATLVIRHEAVPADDADFAYVSDLGPFLLRAPSQTQVVFSRPPGVYRVHELLHPAWALADLTCQGDADGGTIVQPEEATILADLDHGETIICVFRHTRTSAETGTITLVQATTPADDTPFAYSGDLGGFSLAAPGEATRTWTAVPPGGYTVRQSPLAGWRLDAITCQGDGDGGSTLSPGQRTAALDLDAGETLVCTFANTRTANSGAITITHAPTPADNTPFSYGGALGRFTLRAPGQTTRPFDELAAGVYGVDVRLPAGWRLSGIACVGDGDDGSVVDLTAARVAIDLDLGETIICRFLPVADATTPAGRVYIPYLGR